jgi:hypothetical protein
MATVCIRPLIGSTAFNLLRVFPMPFLADPLDLDLIRHIPVAQHSVPVRSEFWTTPCAKTGRAGLHHALFAGAPEIRLTRDWLRHAVVSDEMRALAVLLWGYPTGARGNRHLHWLAHLPDIARAAAAPILDWQVYRAGFTGIGGLGISTISKLACFFGRRFVAPCASATVPGLILDSRILAVLAADRWAELHSLANLTYLNAPVRYLEYLRCLHDFAVQWEVSPEQVEFFLFAHGDSF